LKPDEQSVLAPFFHLQYEKVIMAKKENKGGLLSNEQIEKELERTGANEKGDGGYRGMQDTGEDIVRELGTPVQQSDGRPPEQSTDRNQE
jgi:hypothetical protein